MSNTSNSEDNLHSELTVFIFNMAEDVWPYIQGFSDPKRREREINECAFLGDVQLFSNIDEPELLFITPYIPEKHLVDYFKNMSKGRYLEILSPTQNSGQTCLDIIKDKKIIDRIKLLSKNYKKVTLISYSSTYQFYELANKLIDNGINVYLQESPSEEAAWTVNFFGSKSGIRQLGQQSIDEEPDFIIPDGLICVGILDAAKIAADKYIENDGVVLKTNKGHAGGGVLIFREGDLPSDYKECEKELYKILSTEDYWSQFPIIIEDLVNVNTAIAGGFPNVEFKIQKSGEISFLYCCGLRVTKDGEFQGTEISNDITNDRYLARIMDLGFFIGEKYANAGYRGYFDVDMIAAKNGKIYVNESNTRRTGGTHAFKVCQKLLGRDFMNDYYIIQENWYSLNFKKKLKFTQLLKFMDKLLFNPKTKEGIVFPSATLLSYNKLVYIIIAETEKAAVELEKEMKDILISIK
jgi:hypothetical protein